MKTKKLFYLFAAMVLSFGVVSCGDDEDPVMGDKSDLIGSYAGDEFVYLTNMIRDTAKLSPTIRFERYSQDADRLSVSTNDLGTGILASSFRISKDSYTFNMAAITLNGLQGNEIPTYITNWFTGTGGLYTSLDKIDLKLTSTSGKFDRTTNKMDFIYKGDLIIYPRVGTDLQSPQTHKIEFKYSSLRK